MRSRSHLHVVAGWPHISFTLHIFNIPFWSLFDHELLLCIQLCKPMELTPYFYEWDLFIHLFLWCGYPVIFLYLTGPFPWCYPSFLWVRFGRPWGRNVQHTNYVTHLFLPFFFFSPSLSIFIVGPTCLKLKFENVPQINGHLFWVAKISGLHMSTYGKCLEESRH